MNRLAVISIVLSVLTIQASGKSDFSLELPQKEEEIKLSFTWRMGQIYVIDEEISYLFAILQN